MTEQVFRVASIGYGLSAKVFQLPFIPLVPRLSLYAILQRTPKPNDDAQVDHPSVKVYRSYDELLADPLIDAVLIGTASHTHFDLCMKAIVAEKNVLCEKPFTLTTAEADSLISAASKRKVLLTVFHNRRWDADFLTVKSLIDQGKLGRVLEFESHFDVHSPRPREGWDQTWRTQTGTGSGALYDLGSHLIDQSLQLFGKPEQVTGFLYSQREDGVQQGDTDSMTLLLYYSSGPLVTLKASVFNVEEQKLRFWVRGDKGTFKKYHLDVQEGQILGQQMSPSDPNFGIEPDAHYAFLSVEDETGQIQGRPFPTVKAPTYRAFYEQFADALSGNGEPPVSAESARDVVHIIELAIESARLRKTVDVN